VEEAAASKGGAVELDAAALLAAVLASRAASALKTYVERFE